MSETTKDLYAILETNKNASDDEIKKAYKKAALKHHPELSKMPLLRKGNRLSVLPVSSEEWEFIVQLAC